MVALRVVMLSYSISLRYTRSTFRMRWTFLCTKSLVSVTTHTQVTLQPLDLLMST